ncbi:MAG: transglycosylase SLT domain-containing protein, partial [Muribaculaceae bacterium]|nr:transglycosylase SLT domain-containing protein [Muribaculaceae bacterium]
MKYKFLLLTTITLISTCLGASAKNILSLKESITDNAIVYPSSFETDTKEMMENWYLKNYVIIDDSNVDSRNYGQVSDAEYIRRLKKLPTVIEMPFNQIVRSYIERYVVKSRTLVAQMLGMCPYYMPIFEEALERHNMPLELKYIPIIESALNPNAVSPAGAGGLWQFMVTTAKGVGLSVNSQIDERRDPYRSSEKAAVYFKQLYDTYHDWSLAIAAYNCGPGNVNKAIRRAGTDHPDFWEIYNYLPRETRGYVPAFIAANYVMTYYREHNINPSLTKKPLIIDTVVVNKRIYLDQISQVLNIPLDEIKILNPQYRGNVIPGDVHPYTLALPSQQIYSYIMAEDRIENYHKTQFEPREKVEPGDIRSIVDEMEGQNGIIWHEVTEGEDFIDIADRYG